MKQHRVGDLKFPVIFHLSSLCISAGRLLCLEGYLNGKDLSRFYPAISLRAKEVLSTKPSLKKKCNSDGLRVVNRKMGI